MDGWNDRARNEIFAFNWTASGGFAYLLDYQSKQKIKRVL